MRLARRGALCRRDVARVQFAQHHPRSRGERAFYDAVKSVAPLLLSGVSNLSDAIVGFLEESGGSGREPPSSRKEPTNLEENLTNSGKEAANSGREYPNSSGELPSSGRKLPNSLGKLGSFFFHPSQPSLLQKANSWALPVKLRLYANARYTRSRLPRPWP